MFSFPHDLTNITTMSPNKQYLTGSKYIVLSNNNNMSQESNASTSSDFVCTLPEPLLIPRDSYSVGLISLQYTREEPKKENTIKRQTRALTQDKLFPDLLPPIINKFPLQKIRFSFTKKQVILSNRVLNPLSKNSNYIFVHIPM